eukprot:4868389-Pyramimonas_sp.AAC.1
MSASHNPGGPEEDWGIKFNYTGGECPSTLFAAEPIHRSTGAGLDRVRNERARAINSTYDTQQTLDVFEALGNLLVLVRGAWPI